MRHTIKKIITCIFLCIIACGVQAQTQQGYIKTIGRKDKKGEPLGNVSIRLKGGHNAVLSNSNGQFALVMHGKKVGDSYSLQQVRKSGYQLNDAGVIGRSFAYSDKVPHTIVMVSTAQLQKDKQRIESNAYRVAEKNYEEKVALLEQQVNDNSITMKKYQEELLSLQESFEKYQLMIDGLADHYAHTDYDDLTDKEREINICIEEGNLERADSLIHQLFNPVDILKRNKEAIVQIEQQLSQANALIASANAEMAKVLKQQKKEAEYLYNLYTIALAKFDNEKAKFYIETRAELDSTVAEWQFDAAFYLHKQNRFKAAKHYYTRALDASRALTKENQQANEQGIASTLNNLASLYIDTQQHNDAEAAYKETLEIYRRLAQEEPELHEPDVALILNNLALLYIEIMKYGEAEDMCKEALEIRRRLANTDAQLYEPFVANTLNNLALLYSNTQRYEESEQAYKEALQIYRRHAESNPHQYEPYVAVTLNALAILYYNTMRYEESEQMCKETQNIRTKFNENSSQSNDPNVATTLNNLATFYYNTQRYEESEAMYKEAQAIYKHLARENPQIYEPYIAMTLNNLGGVYSDTRRFEESEQAYNEALEMRKRFALDDSLAYWPDVARTLNNIASLYFDTRRYEESTEIYKEALEIRRKLAKENPQAYRVDVAMTLNNLTNLYHATKQFVESENSGKEALEIYYELAKENPQLHEPGVAFTLNNLASIYYRNSKFAAAEEKFKEAITLYKKLAAADTQKYSADVARILSNLASLYSDTKRYTESETLYREALDIRQKLAAEKPHLYEQSLAITHYNMGLLFLRSQHYKKGIAAFESAFKIYSKLAAEEPLLQQHYTNSLKWLVQLYKNEEEHTKGYEVYEEYMPILRKNFKKHSDLYKAEYIKALGYHTSQCLIMGQYAKAEEYAREEAEINPGNLQIYRDLAIALVLQERYAEAEKIYTTYRPRLNEEFKADLKKYKKQKKITKKHKNGLRRINLILND